MSISVESFLQSLIKTGIIAPAEAEALANNLPAEKRAGDADELARDLVRQGKITRFQAAAIYQNKADGLVLGNYLILDKLGAGGMGQVFRARHRRIDRVVAIKVLSKKLLDSPDAVARFQREVKAAARLTHPHIVTAYDADEAGGLHFLVMEYVDGSDLAAIVKQQGALPVNQALDYLLQAARGLEHAHGEGVVHRDIKPSNFLLDKKGTLKILDMGLARMSDPLADPSAAPGADLTHSGSIMGTIDYMAPEQAMDSRQADARSDIYSLGCTLHYLLTARPPFSGDTVLKRLTAHQQAAIPLLSTLRPDTPPGLDEIFGRMMAKNPAARFQTSKELVASLESLRNQPVSKRPVPISAQPIAAQPIVAQRVAVVPATPIPSGVQDLESIMLPGIEPGSRRVRKSASKMPVIAAVVALLLAAAGAAVWKMSRDKQGEVAQSAPALPAVAQQPSAEVSTAVEVESKSAPMPANEDRNPAEPLAPAVVVPAKPESPVNGATKLAPPATPATANDVASSTAALTTRAPPAPATPAPAPMPTSEQTPAADAKLPIPAAEAQREALKLLKDVYKEDYAAAKLSEAKTALAQKLLDESQQAKDDTAALYMVFHEARDLAVDAANPELLERAIGMLAGRYQIEPLKEFATALEEMAGKPHPAEANRAIGEAALTRVEEAAAAEDFETAKRLADVGVAAARKAKDASLSKQAIEAGKSVTAAKLQSEAWHKAQATLEQTPDDPAANLLVGRYLCFVQGDWDQGLAHLSKGPSGPLKDLAAKSQKPSDDTAALVELGDAWYAAAEKAKGKDKPDLRAGAAYWYSIAEPGLSGLTKTKIEKRLADLGGKVVARPTRSEIPVANGLWLPQTFDCSTQAYPVVLNPDFNLQKSWTLTLEFLTPNLDGGSHQLLFWGDGRISHDPLCLRIDGDHLEARICDTFKDQDDAYALEQELSRDVIGSWQHAAVHFDAATNAVSLFVNGALAAQGRSTIVPAVDKPMKMFVGGEHETGQRFYGQVRNVWLGNQDRLAVPDTRSVAAVSPVAKRAPNPLPKSSAVATTAVGKMPETTELILAPGIGIKFRLIPAGSFAMGRAGNKGMFFEHKVQISQPFYLGFTEVTQAQWQAVMGNNPSEKTGDLARPVEKISWNDCQVFLQRLNQSPLAKNLRFRLPTEAEWEYACRAGTKTEFYFGDDPKPLPEYAWFKDNAGGTSHPVAQLKPNAWGLYDMLGNCFEWCSDWYEVDYYKQSPETDPTGPSTGVRRALRGGARSAPFDACSSVNRRGMAPDAAEPIFSLRLVCQPKTLLAAAPRNTATAGGTSSGGRRPVAFAQAEAERQVANWVLSIGGKIKVTSPATPNPNPPEITDPAQLPADAFVVVLIDLHDNKTFTTDDLSRFDNLVNLLELNVIGTAVGDEALKHAALHRKLNTLHLNRTKITDDGMAAIENLTSLQKLYLMRTQISDAGLAHLRGLSELKAIGFQETRVTDAGVASLASLADLRWVGASGNQLTDVGMKSLAQLKMVSVMELMDLKITDAGLLPLGSMPHLVHLYLQNNQITDRGLETLAAIPTMKELNLGGTKITDPGVQKFRARRPDCEIVR